MALKSSGILEAFMRGSQERDQLEQQKFQNERALEEEKLKQERLKQEQQQLDQAHEQFQSNLDLQQKHLEIQRNTAELATKQAHQVILDRVMRGIPTAEAEVTPDLQSSYGAPQTQQVKIGGKTTVTPTPEAFASQQADLARISNAPKEEAQQAVKDQLLAGQLKVKQLEGENALNLEAARAQGKSDLEFGLEAERHNNIMARDAEKARFEFEKAMAIQKEKDKNANYRAQIAATKAAVAAGTVKLTSAIQSDVTGLEKIQENLLKAKALLEKRGWDYFNGPSVKGLKNAAGAIGGESDEDWAAIQKLLGEAYTTQAHETFGSAFTASEKGLLNKHVLPPSHLMDMVQAKTNINYMLEAIPGMIDRIYEAATPRAITKPGTPTTPAKEPATPPKAGAGLNFDGTNLVPVGGKK